MKYLIDIRNQLKFATEDEEEEVHWKMTHSLSQGCW